MKFNLPLNFMYFLVLFLVFAQVNADDSPNCTGDCNDYQICDSSGPIGNVNCTSDMLYCWDIMGCGSFNPCLSEGIYQDEGSIRNFYVCIFHPGTKFKKYFFTCPDMKYFDPLSKSCVYSFGPTPTPWPPTPPTPPTPKTTKSTTTSTTTTTTSTTSSTTTSTTQNPFPDFFSCMTPGVYGHPEDCKIYYWCNQNLDAFPYICPGMSYFNENILKCSEILTPECYRKITNGTVWSTHSLGTNEDLIDSTHRIIQPTLPAFISTFFDSTSPTIPPAPETETTELPIDSTSSSTTSSTEPPTSPSTEPTTPSTVPPTTPPTTPSTVPSTTPSTQAPTTPSTTSTTYPPDVPEVPFKCPGMGVFPRPNDCKTYYRCSLSGKAYLYTCPSHTYYNEFYKTCNTDLTPRCQSILIG